MVLNVRVSARRRPLGPGVRTQTVTVSLPTSKPATRSNMTSIASLPPSARKATIASTASVRRDLCQDTDPRARSTIQRQPKPPRHTPATGSPAPVCLDVTGRPPILISQCNDSKSATDYTSYNRAHRRYPGQGGIELKTSNVTFRNIKFRDFGLDCVVITTAVSNITWETWPSITSGGASGSRARAA
jgi:hypothetical protein